MKKVFGKLLAIVFVCCMAFSISACGGSTTTQGGSLVSGSVSLWDKSNIGKPMNDEEIIAYLTDAMASNQSPKFLSLEDGVLVRTSVVFYNTYFFISDFEMYMQEVDGVLIAQGSYSISSESETSYAQFYYDGKYLETAMLMGDEINITKDERSISQIDYVLNNNTSLNVDGHLGKPQLVEEVIASLEIVPTLDSLTEIVRTHNSNTSTVYTITGSDAVVKDYFVVTLENSTCIIFDTSYNIIGYRPAYSYFTIEKTDKNISTPPDFNNWIISPKA